MIGIPGNTFLGIDRFLFGTLVGMITFFLAIWLDGFLRKKNNDRVLFYYQKVVLPIFLLSVISFVFFMILD